MATYYVSALAAGGGTGTEGDPWTVAEYEANIASLNRASIFFKADGPYDLTKSLDLQGESRIAGYGTTINDGVRAVLRATADNMKLIRPTDGRSKFGIHSFELNANGYAGVTGIETWNGASLVSMVNCKAIECMRGFFPNAGSQHVLGCIAQGCGTGFAGNARFVGCLAFNGGAGFTGGGGGTSVVACVAANNTGSGYTYSPSYCTAFNSIAYGNGGHGFAFGDVVGGGGQSLLWGLIAYGNASTGVELNADTRGAATWIQYIASGGNGLNTNYPTHLDNVQIARDTIILTADPFVDAANGDFNLNDAEGGGALLREANFAVPDLPATLLHPYRAWVKEAFGGGGGLSNPFHSEVLG